MTTPPREEFRCTHCPKVFEVKRNLTKHAQRMHKKARVETAEKGGDLKCKMCGKAFPRLSHLRRHQLVHLNVREWECALCDYKFSQKAHLVRHLQRKHADVSEANIINTIEPIDFDSEDSEDVNSKDSGPSTSGNSGREKKSNQKELQPASFPCDKCGQEFHSEYHAKRHVKMFHRIVKCKCCGGLFDGHRAYTKHKMKMRDDVHRCEKCKATFRRDTELSTHRNACLGMYSFVCVPCGEGFSQRVQLDRHWIRNHFGPMKVCQQRGCMVVVEKPTEMTMHLAAAHGLTACGYCGSEDGSKLHISIHHWMRLKSPIRIPGKPTYSPQRSRAGSSLSVSASRQSAENKEDRRPDTTSSDDDSTETESYATTEDNVDDDFMRESSTSSSPEGEKPTVLVTEDSEPPVLTDDDRIDHSPSVCTEEDVVPPVANTVTASSEPADQDQATSSVTVAGTSQKSVTVSNRQRVTTKVEIRKPSHVQLLVNVPAGSERVQISERVPKEMLDKYAELRELESISITPSSRDRELIVCVDVQGMEDVSEVVRLIDKDIE